MRAALSRLAASAPVPTFVVAGLELPDAVQDLQLDSRLRLVQAPRQANLLLLAGTLTDALVDAAVSAHDVMPSPRAVVAWRTPTAVLQAAFPRAVVVDRPDPAETLVTLHRSLLSGERPSTPPIRPDVDPAPWRGEGPYGQGGSGMTGGVPYGRPMATREDDRDGLSLDALPVPVGPLFGGLPDGLTARVTFKGDLVHGFELQANPYRTDQARQPGDPFVRALTGPVPVDLLEVTRARSLLRWTARALRVHGLEALSTRALELARRAQPSDVPTVQRLSRWIGRWWCTGAQLRRVGVLEPALLRGLAVGPVGRAAGVAEDLRATDPAYRRLGFTPRIGTGGDAAARLRQRLSEAVQALELAGRAQGLRTGGVGAVESPRGRLEPRNSPTDRLLELLPSLVTGLEWGDAVTTLTSLDLDLREAAAVGSAAAQEAT